MTTPHKYRVIVGGMFPRHYHRLEDAQHWANTHHGNSTICVRDVWPNGATGVWRELA